MAGRCGANRVRTAALWCVITGVAIKLSTPNVGGLSDAVGALREWQHDASPMQLHPGDLGWFWQFGAETTAAAVRIWSRDAQILAVGLLDSHELLRLTIAPDAQRDDGLAQQLVADLAVPERGVLPAGKVAVETPNGALVQDLLPEVGWNADEPWTPLRRDLTEPVKQPGLADRGDRAGAGSRVHGRAPVCVRQSQVHRRAVAHDDDWTAVPRGSVSARVRRPGQRGGGGDGVVGRRGEARVT